MAKKLKVYSANAVGCNFAGIDLASGRGDSDFVAITHPEESYTYKQGHDGEGTRSATGATYAEVNITLMQTSAGNAALSAIHQGDIKTEGGEGIAPILIRNRQGLSIFAAAEAWITKTPDENYAKEAGTVVWTVGCHNPQHFIGGQ